MMPAVDEVGVSIGLAPGIVKELDAHLQNHPHMMPSVLQVK